MSQFRPKILSRFDLSGALTLRMYVDDGGSFNTTVDASITSGSYYMAWDQQNDDFLKELHEACYDALVASAVAAYSGTNDNGKPIFWIDDDQKVHVAVGGSSADLRIAWTEQDGAEIAGILGFDSSADLDLDTNNNWTATADDVHAYGWYADEDGQMPSLEYADHEVAEVMQSIAPSGHVVTQYLDSRHINALVLAHLSRELTFSDGVAYTSDPVHPYDRNKPLECWWHQARQGIEFRVYRQSVALDRPSAEHLGGATGGDVAFLEDTGQAWNTSPQEHKGKIMLKIDFANNSGFYARFYIASHTATRLTFSNGLHNEVLDDGEYRIYDQPYRTYVVDLNRMQSFAPRELRSIAEFDIAIPLLRFES